MPHRTVFQWGKNHAHPFTVFIGGVVIGALVTAAAGYAWVIADQIDDENSQPIVQPVPQQEVAPEPTETPSPEVTTPVQF